MLFSVLMAIAAQIRSRAFRGLAYGPHPRQRLDIRAPVGADGEASVVVVLPPAAQGVSERGHRNAVGRVLASRGFVALVPRFHDDADLALRLEDAARACAWARAHAGTYGGDPQRVFVLGEGDAAGVAAMLALDPVWLEAASARGALRGVIGVQGLYDLAPLHATTRSRDGAPPMLLIAGADGGEEDRSTGWLARTLRILGSPVAEIRYPGLSAHSGLHGLAGVLGLRRTPLQEVERFLRLGALEPAA
ncbi:MAG: hypothetical protein WDN45_13420 [Caulobacteraceae bacterium]